MNKIARPPKNIIVNTGEQYRVTKTIDDFFIGTKEYFQRKYNLEDGGFQIRSGELAYEQGQVTDDRITYLAYEDVILASVFQTRTDFNFVRYTFFRNLKKFSKRDFKIKAKL